MMNDRSKIAEAFLGSFFPANFPGSEPPPTKTPASGKDATTALELLVQISKERNRAVSIRYGKRGQWTIELAGYTGRGFFFIQAVSNLFAEMFPELKAQVEAEKEENIPLGHA